MISWQRALFAVSLAFVEATPASLLVTLAGGRLWALLIVITLLGALADWQAQRWLPLKRQRPAQLALAAVVGFWVVKSQIADDFGLLSGWGAALDLLAEGRVNTFLAYLSFLGVVYAFWRGTHLLEHDSLSLGQFFGRAVVVLLFIFGMGAFLALSDSAAVTGATLQLLAFFASGLLAIALANLDDESDPHLRRLDWRGLLTLCGAILAVLSVGVLATSVFGEQVAGTLAIIWRIVVLLGVLITAPLLIALTAALSWLLSLVNLDELSRVMAQQNQQQQQQQLQALGEGGTFPDWLLVPIQIFCAAVPILIVVALFVLIRRRDRRAPAHDEERQSLLSWSGLASDLRGLLGGLRGARQDDLRSALARLRGGDPASRVRRSYIRLLLAAEAREAPRPPAETPREYERTAVAALNPARAISALTRLYERARYHSDAATPADAEAAERAWNEIDRAGR